MKFDVMVRRTERRESVFRVEAKNVDTAIEAGLAAARDYDFGGGTACEVEYRALAPERCIRSSCKNRSVVGEERRA